MKELSKKIGDMTYDGLLTDITPRIQVSGGVIRLCAAETTLNRGTILARSSGTAGDGKLVILGTVEATNETLTPDCILCDDVIVGTTADVNTAIYTAGCFDSNKVIVAAGYTVTADDIDQLRQRGIVFKAASPAD